MSKYNFRPATRENVGLVLGLAGPSGGGKTYTAMRLASGMAKGQRFAVIDTENGRASHYADQFDFDVLDLVPPFTPEVYGAAIEAADAAGYPVIVVDSMSHEYAGEGGVLDMQEAEFKRLGGRESVKMLSWSVPKQEHKAMVQKILRVKANVILCFRAEAKIEMVKNADGRFEIVPKKSLTGLDGWIPITEKSLPFELTVSMMLLPDHPGVGHPIKLQEQHKPMFPEGAKIDEECGRRIAEWASGGSVPAVDPTLQRLRDAALGGKAKLAEEWEKLGKAERVKLGQATLSSLKEAADLADRNQTGVNAT